MTTMSKTTTAQSSPVATETTLNSRPETLTSAVSGELSGVVLSSQEKNSRSKSLLPSPYDFTDFRAYLQAFLDAKKAANPAYSASAFVRKAGLGANSRGYLKRVIDGKRNLTAATVRSFSEALGLQVKESLYFENLVYFNQAEKPQDKKYYFERLVGSASGSKSKPLAIMESQLRYFNHWYTVAIRELVAVEGFVEDASWISKSLRGKVSVAEVRQAIEDLLNIGLLKRNAETGKLEQCEELIQIAGGVYNSYWQQTLLGFIDRGREAIENDEYLTRNASFVTLSLPIDRMAELKSAIDEFRDQITKKFGVSDRAADSVVNVNVQLFQLTNPKIPQKTPPVSKENKK